MFDTTKHREMPTKEDHMGLEEISNEDWEGGHYVEGEPMIPEEAITLHETVGEIIERRLGDYVHAELPTYGEDRWDKMRGILYVATLLVTTALAGFFIGRESLRHYPDPVLTAPQAAPTIELHMPLTKTHTPKAPEGLPLWD